ncbi:MAG: CoA-binding protein [Calditrichia bacterium]
MNSLNEKIKDFLGQEKIAVAGVSRNPEGGFANRIYQKLKQAGYRVFAVNPYAKSVEGDRCYPDLKAIPGGVDGLVICTHPEISIQIVRDCIEAGVPRVWMHSSFGEGITSQDAVKLCRENDISVIAGACPMMYCPPVDFGHRCMRAILKLTGKLPQ